MFDGTERATLMVWTMTILPLALLWLRLRIPCAACQRNHCTFRVYQRSYHNSTSDHLRFYHNYALLAVPFFIFAGELMGRVTC